MPDGEVWSTEGEVRYLTGEYSTHQITGQETKYPVGVYAYTDTDTHIYIYVCIFVSTLCMHKQHRSGGSSNRSKVSGVVQLLGRHDHGTNNRRPHHLVRILRYCRSSTLCRRGGRNGRSNAGAIGGADLSKGGGTAEGR